MILPEIEKAEELGSFLRVFEPEPLKGNLLSKFYYDKTMASRTGDPYESPMNILFEECTTPGITNAHLLLGHGGCGKSAELQHLKQRFEKVEQPVWMVDFEKDMDVFQANCWDIMLGIAEGLCSIAAENNIKGLDGVLGQVSEYLKADREVSNETERVSGAGASVGAEAKTPSILRGVLNLFATLKFELKANTTTRTIVKEKMERRASEWLNYINIISDSITSKLNGKQPVIIFENVDKIQPPARAMEIFHYRALAQIPFPVIYTFPISLSYDSQFTLIEGFYKPHILPMIKVRNIDKTENDEGIIAIRDIIELRANPALFEEKALKLLIMQTGGELKGLFRCIISSAHRADRRKAEKIEIEDVNRALSGMKSDLTRRISLPDYQMLANIYNDPKYKEQIEDKQFILKQMQALVVLEYNGDRWHGLHPLIAEFLKKQEYIHDSN